jgi:hypothetical protein
VLLLFEAGRWRAGSALLVASLLIKPLLLPLVVLPLLARRWQPLLTSLAAGLALLGAAVLAVPGGTHVFTIARYVAGGAALTGQDAVFNISIGGVAERYHAVGLGWAARGAVIVLAALATYAWTRRPVAPGGIASIGTLLLSAFLLAGSLSESHHLLVVTPCLLAGLALQDRPSRLVIALPALLLLAFPRYYLGSPGDTAGDLQIRYFLAELLLTLAAAVAVWQSANEPAEDRLGLESVG